jgi:hypothetical protein
MPSQSGPLQATSEKAFNPRFLGLVALLSGFYVLLMFQMNQPPLERYPNWDRFWVDTMTAGNLETLRTALAEGELPSINPYVNLGWYVAGDTTLFTSYLNPVHLLAVVLGSRAVVEIRTFVFFLLSGIGLLLLGEKYRLSTVARIFLAAMYVTIPINQILLYQSNMSAFLYLTPLLLYLLHRMHEEWDLKTAILLYLYLVFAFSSGDVYGIIALVPVVGAYGFMAALAFYRLRFPQVLLRTVTLLLMAMAATAFYAVPLLGNAKERSALLAEYVLAGITKPIVTPIARIAEFFGSRVGWAFVLPHDSASLLMYVPAVFYFVIFGALIAMPRLRRANPKIAAVLSCVLFTGFILLLETVVYYLVPAASTNSPGLLRVQIKLWPYFMTICFVVCMDAFAKAAVPKEVAVA